MKKLLLAFTFFVGFTSVADAIVVTTPSQHGEIRFVVDSVERLNVGRKGKALAAFNRRQRSLAFTLIMDSNSSFRFTLPKKGPRPRMTTDLNRRQFTAAWNTLARASRQCAVEVYVDRGTLKLTQISSLCD